MTNIDAQPQNTNNTNVTPLNNREQFFIKPFPVYHSGPSITLFSQDKPASKTLWLDAEGQLRKAYATPCSQGNVLRVYLGDQPATAFTALLQAISPRVLATYGNLVAGALPPTNPHGLEPQTWMSRQRKDQALLASDNPTALPVIVERSKSFLEHAKNQSGIMALDYDAPASNMSTTLSPQQLIDMYYDTIPDLHSCGWVWRPSASSCLTAANSTDNPTNNDKENRVITGIEGQRVWIPVVDTSDIPRAMKALHRRLIAQGYGYPFITATGTVFSRSPVDTKLSEPQQPDFLGSPHFPHADIQQNWPDPITHEGALLNTATAIPDLSREEETQYGEQVNRMTGYATPFAQQVRTHWVTQQRNKLTAMGHDEASATKILEFREKGTLMGGDIVVLDKFRNTPGYQGTRVADLFTHPGTMDALSCADPMEPEYGGGLHKAKILLNFQGRYTGVGPIINSYAHGGRQYTLRLDYPTAYELLNNVDAAQLTMLWRYALHWSSLSPPERQTLINMVASRTHTPEKLIAQQLLEFGVDLGDTHNLFTPQNDVPPLPKGKPDQGGDVRDTLQGEELLYHWAKELNQRYGVLKAAGGGAAIVECAFDPVKRRRVLRRHNPRDMKLICGNMNTLVTDGTRKPVEVNAFDWWLKWPNRNQYDNEIFKPEPPQSGQALSTAPTEPMLPPGRTLNTWLGWGVVPVEGDCSIALDFIKESLCSGDERQYNYVLNWFAEGLQYPTKRAQTSLVMSAAQGIGKNLLMDHIIGPIWGTGYTVMADVGQIIGRFADLSACTMLFSNEIDWAHNKRTEGRLKSLITDRTRSVEQKYCSVDTVPNYTRVVLASNETWTSPAGLGDRRFLMLNTRLRKAHTTYYDRIRAHLANGGLEAFMHFLVKRDLTGVDLTKRPVSINERDLVGKMRMDHPVIMWLYNILNDDGDGLKTRTHRGQTLLNRCVCLAPDGREVDHWRSVRGTRFFITLPDLFHTFEETQGNNIHARRVVTKLDFKHTLADRLTHWEDNNAFPILSTDTVRMTINGNTTNVRCLGTLEDARRIFELCNPDTAIRWDDDVLYIEDPDAAPVGIPPPATSPTTPEKDP